MEHGCSKQIAMRKKIRNKDYTVCYIELGNHPDFTNLYKFFMCILFQMEYQRPRCFSIAFQIRDNKM